MSNVTMVHYGLELAAPIWPTGCTIQAYRPGDAAVWLALHRAVGIYGAVDDILFVREFGIDDDNALPARQFFVSAAGRPVATGTMWFGQPAFPAGWGRLHWLAVHPDWQRRGLATNLIRFLFQVGASMGYSDVYLTTGSENEAAIQLYRRVGFVPFPRDADEAVFWQQ